MGLDGEVYIKESFGGDGVGCHFSFLWVIE